MEQETRVCTCCGRELPISAFSIHTAPNGKRTLFKMCDECRFDKIRKAEPKRIATRKAKSDEIMRNAEEQVTNARNLRLQDFTPREMMQELARRGYEGTLRFVEVKEIDITNF